jgi:hypothetical protein
MKLTENRLVTVISFSFYQKTNQFFKSNRTNFTENRKNQPVFNYCNPCSREVSTGISLIHAPPHDLPPNMATKYQPRRCPFSSLLSMLQCLVLLVSSSEQDISYYHSNPVLYLDASLATSPCFAR